MAGRLDQARIYWDSLVVVQEENVSQSQDPDVLAQGQGQLARNYARAGRADDAGSTLELAMNMPVGDEALPSVRRRWAQTLR